MTLEKLISYFRHPSASNSLFFISVLLISYGIYQQIWELVNRVNVGIGLTDEAFGIMHALDRGLNGQTSSTPLFADLTSTTLRVVQYDIRSYRILGYLVLACVSLLLCWRIIQVSKGVEPALQVVWTCLTACFLVLLIPSSFRYLLVTPSYQWLILVASIVLVSLVARNNNRGSLKSTKFVLPAAALCVGIIELSRLLGGFATWLLISIYLIKKKDLRSLLRFNFYVACLNICYIALNLNVFLDYFARLYQMKRIDPVGSNLLFESWDVAKAAGLGFLLVSVSAKITSLYFTKGKSLEISKGYYRIFLQILSLMLLLFSFQYKDLPHILAFACMALIGLLIGLSHRVHDGSLYLLSLAPIISQFGSGTSASYLIIPMIAVGFHYLIFSLPAAPSVKLSKLDFKSYLIALCSFCIVAILLFAQFILSSTSYENGYGSKPLVKDPIHGLGYTPEKLASITRLREEVEKSYTVKDSRILDLSYWHPGVIFYVGGLQFPIATFDKFYSQTIDQQVKNVVTQEGIRSKNKKVPIIIESYSDSPSLVCLELSGYIKDNQLRRSLINYEFNPRVMEVAIYRSVKEDLTLYPKNISILMPCD